LIGKIASSRSDTHPATGLLWNKTDAAGKKTTYTYHSSGRLHTRVWARPGAITTTYAHNPFGDQWLSAQRET
jgi:YD repeat-containing protein